MQAQEIMTKDVVTISGSATVAEAVKLMKEKLQRWRAWTNDALDVDDDIVKLRKAAN